jgi:hypothetical protein
VLCLSDLWFWGSSPAKFEEFLRLCEERELHLVIECDYNSHHMVWVSTDCNDRGVALLDFLSYSHLEILNQGNDPAFCRNKRSDVIDTTTPTLTCVHTYSYFLVLIHFDRSNSYNNVLLWAWFPWSFKHKFHTFITNVVLMCTPCIYSHTCKPFALAHAVLHILNSLIAHVLQWTPW